jgi:hypothetical protein
MKAEHCSQPCSLDYESTRPRRDGRRSPVRNDLMVTGREHSIRSFQAIAFWSTKHSMDKSTVQHHNNYTNRLVLPFLSCTLYSEFWGVPNQSSGGALPASAGAPFSSFSVGPRCFELTFPKHDFLTLFIYLAPCQDRYTVIPLFRLGAPLL